MYNFVVTDVYALLLKSNPGDFCPIQSWAKIWVPVLSLMPLYSSSNWQNQIIFNNSMLLETLGKKTLKFIQNGKYGLLKVVWRARVWCGSQQIAITCTSSPPLHSPISSDQTSKFQHDKIMEDKDRHWINFLSINILQIQLRKLHCIVSTWVVLKTFTYLSKLGSVRLSAAGP